MKNILSEWLILFILFVACSIAVPIEESSNGIKNPENSNRCRVTCGKNQRCDDDNNCVCKTGYDTVDLESDDCQENICDPVCFELTEYCTSGNQCACKDGLENLSEPGARVFCFDKRTPSESSDFETTEPSQMIPISTKANTTAPTQKPNTTTLKPTTTTLKPTTTTLKPTTTTLKPPTTPTKPTPKPTHKPKKCGMSPWAITGIIFLVSGMAGLGGYMIYRYKNRGSYRTTSTASQ